MAEHADNPILEAIREKYREEMNNFADDVATGGCRSWDEYKHITGVIEGFVRAERMLLDYDNALTEA